MNESIPQSNVVDAALAAGRALAATPIAAKDDPSNAVIVPVNYKVVALDEFIEKHLLAPRRLKANASLADSDSFVRYVKDFQSQDTRIFANVPSANGAPSFLAILDYHSPEGASWCEHRATYNCSFTEEWRRWMGANRQKMSQADFATFLEENQKLILNPKGAELLEMISTLEGHNNMGVAQALKLSNGKFRLNWEEDVELKGKIGESSVELPLVIHTGIQMFEGGIGYEFDNRLKYRVESRKITFWYEAVDVHLIIKDGVKDVVTAIKEKLSIEPLYGAP
jgi:uncharacterized protein YfdQ (DUF2303 family)